jgi:hypothetical protein
MAFLNRSLPVKCIASGVKLFYSDEIGHKRLTVVIILLFPILATNYEEEVLPTAVELFVDHIIYIYIYQYT